MSWTNKLLETYEMCASQIGIRKEGTILLPTGHIEQRAQIEVVLDETSKRQMSFPSMKLQQSYQSLKTQRAGQMVSRHIHYMINWYIQLVIM